MYEKSRNRLRDIAKNCQEVISAISELLQDEVLDSESFDGPSSTPEVLEAISAMQREAERLRQFVLQSGGVAVSATPAPLPRDPAPLTEITSEDRKVAFHKYAVTLQTMANRASAYPVVHEISQLLWTWFSRRFTGVQPKDFHYSIQRIPVWIRHIILSYSRSLYMGTTEQYLREFYVWCDTVVHNEPYAVPKFIHDMDIEVPLSELTLTAVVLYDVLMDFGLLALTDLTPACLALSAYDLYDLVSANAPELLDAYTHYTQSANILVQCGIISPGE